MRTHGILWFSLLSFGCGHSDSAPTPVITVKIDASVAARAPATIDAGPHSERDAGDAGGDAAASTSNDMPSQSCCVNGFYYACPTHEAFEKCSGFDMSKCYASCEPSDTACTRACSQQSINTPRDPS